MTQDVFGRACAGKLPELEAKRYMSQLLDGMGYCHSRGACHRDIKVVRTVGS